MTALVLNLKPFIVTDDEFAELSKANPELRCERLASGEVTIMLFFALTNPLMVGALAPFPTLDGEVVVRELRDWKA